MKEKFILPVGFIICPKCKNHVDKPKKRKSLKQRNEIKQMICPHCKSTIEYIEFKEGRYYPIAIE